MISVPESLRGVMRSIWPCEQPAFPSERLTDSSAGRPRSSRPHAPGNAHKSARSGRALPSTYHCRKKKTSSRTIKLRHPGDTVGAARGWRWGGVISGCASILISRNIIILPLLRWKEFGLSGPSWLRVGGEAVTYSGLLWDNSSHQAFGVIWSRIQVIWVFEGGHVIRRVSSC